MKMMIAMRIVPLLMMTHVLGMENDPRTVRTKEHGLEMTYNVFRGVYVPRQPSLKSNMGILKMIRKKHRQSLVQEKEEIMALYRKASEKAEKQLLAQDLAEANGQMQHSHEAFQEMFPLVVEKFIVENRRMPHDMEIMDGLRMNNEKDGKGWLHDMRKRTPDTHPFSKFFQFFEDFKTIRGTVRKNLHGMANANLEEPCEIITRDIRQAIVQEEESWINLTRLRTPTKQDKANFSMTRNEIINRLDESVQRCVAQLEGNSKSADDCNGGSTTPTSDETNASPTISSSPTDPDPL